MAQFYSWTDEYIEGLSYDKAFEYYEAITVLEAQQTLIDMNVSAYPKMKEEDAKKLHRDLKKQAYPVGLQREISFEDFIGKMTNGR